MKLNGVAYYWKKDSIKQNKKRNIGFIAQEVEKVIPELINTDDDGYKSMSYDKLTVVLVEAIKELNAKSDVKITALEIECKKLRKENELLKKELATLKSMSKRILALEKALENNNRLVLK